jgi:hypothetical protein
VTFAVDVTDPAELAAVRVKVVVAAGLTLFVPLAFAEVNVPGVMETLVAPAVTQFSAVLAPEFMLVGLAVKDAIVGAEPVPVPVPEPDPEPEDDLEDVPPVQPAKPMQMNSNDVIPSAQRLALE